MPFILPTAFFQSFLPFDPFYPFEAFEAFRGDVTVLYIKEGSLVYSLSLSILFS